ncbi:MAG TPA: prolyl oligopeptidase family serine peptidase [Usitatibacter sp.]|nr:prolyl oligopeptidase family serine peptidase [Usitatibacter sp.]
MRFPPTAAVALALALPLTAHSHAGLHYPATAKRPVTDTYHGTRVVDDYRWLEDARDPAVRQWSLAQLKVARAHLDQLPQRAALKAKLADLYNTAPHRYYSFTHVNGALFAMKNLPPKNQPMLVMMKSAADARGERVLFDPNERKSTLHADWYVPSHDGRYVALSLSDKGSEDGAAHVIDTQTGRELPDVVPRVQYPTGGGSIAWDEKGTGFYYTRYPQGGERPAADANFYQQVYFHKLGTPAASDTYVIGREFPRIAETMLTTTRDGRWLLAAVSNGDGGEHAFYLRDPGGRWTKVAEYADKLRSMSLGPDGRLYGLSLKDAPRGKIVALALESPELAKATVVVPQSEAVIESFEPAASRLYVVYMAGGPSEVRMFDLKGGALGSLPAEPVSSVTLGERLEGDEILVGAQSYLTPFAWYRYAPGGKLERVAELAGATKVNFDDAEVVREMATSKDGTKVPVNILMRKGTKLDGSNPVMLYGYGGYGLNQRPGFSLRNRAWLDAGGILAVVNLRGGGEFGEEWHLAGNLTRKQNVFDDMIGAARHLVERGYTTPARLGAMGGSNGGLLMGAIVTQRPELFRAIVCHVGVLDMLRVETTPNGAFNVTEFGTVQDPAQFAALYAYSPLHRVKDGTTYPAVYFATGENDGRVDPFHSRKMAARLQAANPEGRPVLLRIDMDSGHGRGTALATKIEQDADWMAFLMNELGMTAK